MFLPITECLLAGCSVCDIDPEKCDVCTEEGAKFDEGQSKCIVGDDSGGGDGGLGAGPIIGESV